MAPSIPRRRRALVEDLVRRTSAKAEDSTTTQTSPPGISSPSVPQPSHNSIGTVNADVIVPASSAPVSNSQFSLVSSSQPIDLASISQPIGSASISQPTSSVSAPQFLGTTAVIQPPKSTTSSRQATPTRRPQRTLPESITTNSASGLESTTISSASGAPQSATEAAAPTVAPVPSTPQDPIGGMGSGTKAGMLVAIIAIASLTALIIVYFFLRRTRKKYKDPKYLPGKWLKRKWMTWDPSHGSAAVNSANPDVRRVARSRANVLANRELDRHSSVRSIITLPPYREMALEDQERVIGREGERDGLDEIVVFPETAEEEERRREDRMQAMYELRLQRRQQAAEREARRAGRSSTTSLEANTLTPTISGGATAAAADMEAGGTSATRGRSANALTAVILNDRTRRSSEVTYHEVGQVRLDGSRIRASSTASNPGVDAPLLGSSTSADGRRSRASSTLSLATINLVGNARDSVDNTTTIGDAGIQRLPPSYDGLEWGDAPPYISPVSPVSRRSSIEPGEREGLMSVPVLTVTGASNPNSPHPTEDQHFAGRL